MVGYYLLHERLDVTVPAEEARSDLYRRDVGWPTRHTSGGK